MFSSLVRRSLTYEFYVEETSVFCWQIAAAVRETVSPTGNVALTCGSCSVRIRETYLM